MRTTQPHTILGLVATLAMLTILTACGKADDNTSAADPQASETTSESETTTTTPTETTTTPTEEPTPEPTTFDLAGAVVLTSAGVADVDYVACVFQATNVADCRTTVGEKCNGDTSNLELTKGAEVLVKDASGEIVGVGSLKQGVITKATNPYTDGYFVCSFRFAVSDITDTGDLYQAEVAGRQPKTFKKADASALLVAINEA